jgi:hypothetical protein
MNAIGIQLGGQLHIVINDEGNTETQAELLQLSALRQADIVSLAFGPILKGRNTAAQRRPDPFNQVFTLVRNQVHPGYRQRLLC